MAWRSVIRQVGVWRFLVTDWMTWKRSECRSAERGPGKTRPRQKSFASLFSARPADGVAGKRSRRLAAVADERRHVVPFCERSADVLGDGRVYGRLSNRFAAVVCAVRWACARTWKRKKQNRVDFPENPHGPCADGGRMNAVSQASAEGCRHDSRKGREEIWALLLLRSWLAVDSAAVRIGDLGVACRRPSRPFGMRNDVGGVGVHRGCR